MIAVYILPDSSDLQIEKIIVNTQFAVNFYNLFGLYCKLQCFTIKIKFKKKWLLVTVTSSVVIDRNWRRGIDFTKGVY